MDQLFNPLTSPGTTILLGLSAVAGGVSLSMVRLETAMAERTHTQIALQRAEVCRILPPTEKLELGAYYFQPTTFNPDGGRSGVLLEEGRYVCDRFGATARIERGGYAQFMAIAADITAFNRVLQIRLDDPANPDANQETQVQRAHNMGVWKEPPQATEPEKPDFFDVQ